MKLEVNKMNTIELENLSVMIIESLLLKGLSNHSLSLPVIIEAIKDCGNLEENLRCIESLLAEM